MPRNDRETPPELTPVELSTIVQTLEKETSRRRRLVPSRLMIKVDGVPVHAWDLFSEQAVPIEIGVDAREVQVVALDHEGELPFAVYLPQLHRSAEYQAAAWVILEGRQEITFSMTDPAAGEAGPHKVVIGYRENNFLRALALSARRRRRLLRSRYFDRVLSPAGIATTIATCLILAAALAYFFISGNPSRLQTARTLSSAPQETPPQDGGAAPAAGPETSTGLVSESAKRASKGREGSRDESKRPRETGAGSPEGPQQVDPAQVESEVNTRSLRQPARGAGLLQVKRVYVDSSGIAPREDAIRKALESELARAGFTAAEDAAEADAVLVVERAEGGRRLLELRLVNRSGRILWSGRYRLSAGDGNAVPRRAVEDLVRYIKEQEKRPAGR